MTRDEKLGKLRTAERRLEEVLADEENRDVAAAVDGAIRRCKLAALVIVQPDFPIIVRSRAESRSPVSGDT